MKNVVKYALVGLAGYFVGFYEMKYKVVKAIAEGAVDKNSKEEVCKETES